MTEQSSPHPGNRRLDHVLAAHYTEGLTDLPLAQVRARKAEAEQAEVDLSYLRRLVQGRMDVLVAEQGRRDGDTDRVGSLAGILGDQTRSPARGLGRHSTLQPSRVGEARREVESLVADVDASDVSARTPEEIASSLRVLADQERQVSNQRRAVQQVMDTLSAEVTRRYQSGEASVADLLPE